MIIGICVIAFIFVIAALIIIFSKGGDTGDRRDSGGDCGTFYHDYGGDFGSDGGDCGGGGCD